MKLFFDTSVLVAAFYENHQHHESSLRALERAVPASACCAAHTLAELYSVLTRMPGRHRVAGEQALPFLGNVRERLTVVALDPAEYFSTVAQAAAGGIVGGAIYDLLLSACAMKSRADKILTWNVRHFQMLGPEIARKVKTPV